MLKDFFAEAAQNPKVAMVIGGAVGSAGAASSWFEFAREWINAGALFVGFLLSVLALIAQIVRIKNERRADRRADEMHRAQLEKMRHE